MKNQTNIVEHAINKLSTLLERALTNLFDGFIIERPTKKQLRNDATIPKIHQPFEHKTRK